MCNKGKIKTITTFSFAFKCLSNSDFCEWHQFNILPLKIFNTDTVHMPYFATRNVNLISYLNKYVIAFQFHTRANTITVAYRPKRK